MPETTTKPTATSSTKKLGLSAVQGELQKLADESRELDLAEYSVVKAWKDKVCDSLKKHLSESECEEYGKVCDKWVIGPELKAMEPVHFQNFVRESVKHLESRVTALKDSDLA